MRCLLNSAAYVAEIFRAGIQSIDRGQMEGSRSLGMTHGQAMRYVILPQAFKRMIPPLGNEFIVLLKDSSLAFCYSCTGVDVLGKSNGRPIFQSMGAIFNNCCYLFDFDDLY